MSSTLLPPGSNATPPIDLGGGAQALAVRAVFGALGSPPSLITGSLITGSLRAALDGKAEWYLVNCGLPPERGAPSPDPGATVDRCFWMPALVRSADLPAIVDRLLVRLRKEAKEEGRRTPTRTDALFALRDYRKGITGADLPGLTSAFVEIDHLPEAEQRARYTALSEATGLIWALWSHSGGQSIHAYLAYDRMVETRDPLRVVVQDLLAVLVGGDPAIRDAARLMRLPGHVGERHQRILHVAEVRYAPEDVRDRLCVEYERRGGRDLYRSRQALRLAMGLANRVAKVPTDAEATELSVRLRETSIDPASGDLARAREILGLTARSGRASSRSTKLGGGEIYEVEPAALDPYRGLPKCTRVEAPCCASADRPVHDRNAAGVVLSEPGESPRIYCHRASCCSTVIAARADGGGDGGFEGVEWLGDADPKENKESSTEALKEKEEGGRSNFATISVRRVQGPWLGEAIGEDRLAGLLGRTPSDADRLLVIVRSPHGTGKTEVARDLARALAERYPGEAQLGIVHRCSLAADMCRRLGFASYQEAIDADRLVCVADSLPRVATWKTGPDQMMESRAFSFVLLDEVTALLRHLVGTTIGAEFPRVVATLRSILVNTRYVFAFDADANAETIALLHKIHARETIAVENTWLPAGREAVWYETENALLAEALRSVEAKERTALLTTDGPKQTAKLAALAKGAWPRARILVVDSDTSPTPEAVEALADLDGACAEIDVLVASPSIVSGVDLAKAPYRTFLFARSHDVPASDCMQLARRVRSPVGPIRVWADPRPRSRPTDPCEVEGAQLDIARYVTRARAKYRSKIDAVIPIVVPTALGTLEPVDRLHMDLWASARAYIHRGTNDLRCSLHARLEAAGYTISDAPAADPDEVKRAGKLAKAARAATRTEYNERVANAEEMDREEADRIKRSRSATREKLDGAEKAKLRDFLGRDGQVTKELVGEWDRGRLMELLTMLAVYVLVRESDHPTGLVPDVKRQDQGLTARIRGRYPAARAFAELIALYGVRGRVEEHEDPLAPIPGFEERVAKLLPAISKYLGVRHRPHVYTPKGRQPERRGDVDAIDLLSKCCRKVGLRLKGRKVREGARTRTVYWIDREHAHRRIELARAELARLRAWDAEQKRGDEHAGDLRRRSNETIRDLEAVMGALLSAA